MRPIVIYTGDTFIGKSLSGYAIEQLEVMKNLMSFQKLQQDQRTILFSNGIKIYCESIFNYDKIEIYVPPVLAEMPLEKIKVEIEFGCYLCIRGRYWYDFSCTKDEVTIGSNRFNEFPPNIRVNFPCFTSDFDPLYVDWQGEKDEDGALIDPISETETMLIDDPSTIEGYDNIRFCLWQTPGYNIAQALKFEQRWGKVGQSSYVDYDVYTTIFYNSKFCLALPIGGHIVVGSDYVEIKGLFSVSDDATEIYYWMYPVTDLICGKIGWLFIWKWDEEEGKLVLQTSSCQKWNVPDGFDDGGWEHTKEYWQPEFLTDDGDAYFPFQYTNSPDIEIIGSLDPYPLEPPPNSWARRYGVSNIGICWSHIYNVRTKSSDKETRDYSTYWETYGEMIYDPDAAMVGYQHGLNQRWEHNEMPIIIHEQYLDGNRPAVNYGWKEDVYDYVWESSAIRVRPSPTAEHPFTSDGVYESHMTHDISSYEGDISYVQNKEGTFEGLVTWMIAAHPPITLNHHYLRTEDYVYHPYIDIKVKENYTVETSDTIPNTVGEDVLQNRRTSKVYIADELIIDHDIEDLIYTNSAENIEAYPLISIYEYIDDIQRFRVVKNTNDCFKYIYVEEFTYKNYSYDPDIKIYLEEFKILFNQNDVKNKFIAAHEESVSALTSSTKKLVSGIICPPYQVIQIDGEI